MNPLIKDLQSAKTNLSEFIDVTNRVLHYLPSVISHRREAKGYSLLSSESAGTRKFERPTQNCLFLFQPDEFQERTEEFVNILDRLRAGEKEFSSDDVYKTIDSVSYTISLIPRIKATKCILVKQT